MALVTVVVALRAHAPLLRERVAPPNSGAVMAALVLELARICSRTLLEPTTSLLSSSAPIADTSSGTSHFHRGPSCPGSAQLERKVPQPCCLGPGFLQ